MWLTKFLNLFKDTEDKINVFIDDFSDNKFLSSTPDGIDFDYYLEDNDCSSASQLIVRGVMKKLCFSFKAKINGEPEELLCSYSLEYNKNTNNDCTHLSFSWIIIPDEFRGKGICSYIMSKIILTIISKNEDTSFNFDLVNTVKSGDKDKNLRPYVKILNQYSGDPSSSSFVQYRLFDKADRQKNIKELKQIHLKNEQRINDNFKTPEL